MSYGRVGGHLDENWMTCAVWEQLTKAFVNKMSSNPADTTCKRKGRRVRYVPSRHKQVAEASKSSVRNATICSQLSINETLQVSQAPWSHQSDGSSKCTASTPNSSDVSCRMSILDDVSVIATQTAESASTIMEDFVSPSEVKQKLKFHSGQHDAKPTQPTVTASKTVKGKKAHNPDLVKEIQIKNLYARSIQAAFLESRAKKCLRVRSQKALEQIYKIYCAIRLLSHLIRSAESDIACLDHAVFVLNMVESQEEILETVSKDMPALLEQLREVSSATDGVRNNLPMANVHVSPDSNLKDDIACVLGKCEAQLESFLRCHSHEMTECSDRLKLLIETKNALCEMVEEKCRLNNLLKAVDDTAITESSLLIGKIMSFTPEHLGI